MTKILKLKLDTDYKTIGNSSGRQIDTLAIAMDGRDYNDLHEYNMDYFFDVEDGARKYWLENDAEDYFIATRSKEDATRYITDIDGYNKDLQEFIDNMPDTMELDDMQPLYKAVESSRDDVYKDLYHDWLHGDYRGNFDGVLPQARKYYSDYISELEYDEKTDVITVTIEDENIQALKNDGHIERATNKEIQHAIESMIESKAQGQHSKKMREQEARREQYQKEREYKEKRAKEYKEHKEKQRVEKLQKAIQ